MARRKRFTGTGRRGRPGPLARLSTAQLSQELERRRGMLDDLVRQRDTINAELQELEAAFGPAAGSSPNGRRRRGRKPGRPTAHQGRRGPRARNSTNLVGALQGVLNGKTMKVTDIADAVQKAGYKTNSSNFRVIVNQALLANRKAFKKVARGEYTAR